MIDTAKSTGKKLTIGYQNRFRADSQFLHQAAQRGDLGTFTSERHMPFVVEQYQHGVSF